MQGWLCVGLTVHWFECTAGYVSYSSFDASANAFNCSFSDLLKIVLLTLAEGNFEKSNNNSSFIIGDKNFRFLYLSLVFILCSEEKKQEAEKSQVSPQKKWNGDAGGGHSHDNTAAKGMKRKKNTSSNDKSSKKRKMDSGHKIAHQTDQGAKQLKKATDSKQTDQGTKQLKKATGHKQKEQDTRIAASSKQKDQDAKKLKKAAVPKWQKKAWRAEQTQLGKGAQGTNKKNTTKKLKGILKNKP